MSRCKVEARALEQSPPDRDGVERREIPVIGILGTKRLSLQDDLMSLAVVQNSSDQPKYKQV